MNAKELARLIEAHTEYCVNTYQPSKKYTLEFQEKMTQSLTHFAMCIQRGLIK